MTPRHSLCASPGVRRGKAPAFPLRSPARWEVSLTNWGLLASRGSTVL
jgi:hypothetical protein